MKINVKSIIPQFTHEGARSSQVSPLAQLRRSVMACMLWEDNFYEDGKSIVERIEELCAKVKGEDILLLALEAHKKGFLRHIPLKLIVELLKKRDSTPCIDAIVHICSRPDQMTELIALYWKDGKRPLAAKLKKGLAKAFTKFDEYQLAKWDKDGKIRLKDVLFLCHAKPKDEAQAELWKRLIAGTMQTPDTWEVRLSAGEKKEEAFDILLKEGKMGKLAILRNLRNMKDAGVSKDLVKQELLKKSRPLLPFQFIQASKMVPEWEDIIDESMIQSLEGKEKLSGTTSIFVDVSGSMQGNKVSSKSQVTCEDAAAALAILLREVCDNSVILTFSDALAIVPPRHGMALRDAIKASQRPGGTYLGKALEIAEKNRNPNTVIDRVIVITDEQTHDTPPKVNAKHCYILNISNCKNGIKNTGNQWLTISGFSEACIDYIRETEKDFTLNEEGSNGMDKF